MLVRRVSVRQICDEVDNTLPHLSGEIGKLADNQPVTLNGQLQRLSGVAPEIRLMHDHIPFNRRLKGRLHLFCSAA
jgi:hypothetical protein